MKKVVLIFFVFFLSFELNSIDFDWGYLKFFGQFQYKLEEGEPNTFLIKRLRIISAGDIIKDRIKLKVQLEMNTDKINILDLLGTYILNKHFDINVGRCIIPFSYYSPHSSADLNALNYPYQDIYYAPWRQEGIILKFHNSFSKLYFAIFNGGEKNSFTDNDSEKGYLFKLDLSILKGINLYFTGYRDNYLKNNQWIKKRTLLSAFYIKEQYFFALLQGQYSESDEDITDNDIFSYGYFIHFSFYIKNIEIFARYEFIDRDLNQGGFVETHLTTGINYNLKGVGTKISVNYEKNGESIEIPNDKLIFQFQYLL